MLKRDSSVCVEIPGMCYITDVRFLTGDITPAAVKQLPRRPINDFFCNKESLFGGSHLIKFGIVTVLAVQQTPAGKSYLQAMGVIECLSLRHSG